MLKLAVYLLAASLLAVNTLAARHFNTYRSQLEMQVREPLADEVTHEEAEEIEQIEELWIEQPVDHFASNSAKWQMRYFRNSMHYKEGGPIFIYVGGEWSITKKRLASGLVHDMTADHRGMLFCTEHRYWGKSWPQKEGNSSADDFKHLNIRQVLADLAYFIEQQKTEIKSLANSKVVLVGASYAGSMVAWFTKLYPDMVTAVWASGAPVEARVDLSEYMQRAGESILSQGGKECFTRIESGIKEVARIMSSDEAVEFKNKLKACDNFNPTDEMDKMAFLGSIHWHFGGWAQKNSSRIKQGCEKLMSLGEDDELAFKDYIIELYDKRLNESLFDCNDISYEILKENFNDTIRDVSGVGLQWLYQKCTEFGWFHTTDQAPLHFFEQLCIDVFGNEHNLDVTSEGVQQTNALFAGEYHDKVLFTYGQLDPWHTVGLQNGGNVIIEPGYAHCEDFTSIKDDDSELDKAKKSVVKFVKDLIEKKKTVSNHRC